MINLGNTDNWKSDLLHEYLEWDRRKGRITVEKVEKMDMIVQIHEQFELIIDKMRAFRALVSFILVTWMKLIQPLGKLIHTNRRKIRKNMLSSLVFLTYRD